jgi:DNA invertase Pin-like site-specific DNA recombinase
MNEKILATHLERRAAIYLRQSTLKQVHENRESTARQYALRQRAIDLGWPAERVEVIDNDLGQSGSSTQGRSGFQHLAEEVAHGRVGAIFALEVSRLSRSSADWHRLLDLCGLADVVIADEQAVYTPRDYNDRLLLGLKGTMSEAEQYWMRLRLQGGKLNKARRGELRYIPPTGYEWDQGSEGFRLDPDEQVQRALRLLFERFRLDGSGYAVMRYFAGQGLKLPQRDPATRELRWVEPRESLILTILKNPGYAGAYVYGRREQRRTLVDGQLRRHHTKRLALETWKVCLRDRHPAYIRWEDFMANQKKLHENRTNHKSPEQRGAAREGSALLQGLALCGRCGYRMGTHYPGGREHLARYQCRSPLRHMGDHKICWTVPSTAIDEAVAKLFLEAVQPPEIELGLAVVRETERQAGEVDRQWNLRIDRLRYEARLAERRYKAVDPDNRVVARSLEREWNDKLTELDEVEREHQDVRSREKLDLTNEDRANILALAKDLPRVWNAKSTTNAERKNLLRMLVREVTIGPVEDQACTTRVRLLWQTGTVSDFAVVHGRRQASTTTAVAIVDAVRELVMKNMNDAEIADELNRRGLRTGHDLLWTSMSVCGLRHRRKIQPARPRLVSVPLPHRRADGLYSLRGVADRFNVSEGIVRYWVEKSWLVGVKDGDRVGAWWFDLDLTTIERLEDVKKRGYGPYGSKRRAHSEPHLREEGHCA